MKEAAVEERVDKQVKCYHCEEECRNDHIIFDDKDFCCVGCKTIYELFQTDDLRELYETRNKSKPHLVGRYDFLENKEIRDKLLSFQSEGYNLIQLSLPDIHCSSCVYVLENLADFHPGVIQSSVNFLKKTAEIRYNPTVIQLPELAALLSSIGYPPQFDTEGNDNKKKKTSSALSVKIGVAAFCFGNIMLLSFPEYLGIDESMDDSFKKFFAYLNIVLALPVLLYSARDYFISAYKGLSSGFVNIDVPIALGVVALFGRSLYEILTKTGAGYLDSLGALVFFLLIGKWFQSKTYENLSFERDYKSYFPLAATRVENGVTTTVPIADLKAGDEVVIRNHEIIPADAVLLSQRANIDYSFVTGEEKPVVMKAKDQLYAGGRQIGERITVRIAKPSSQSYLTSLWNNHAFKVTDELGTEEITNRISKYFTFIILAIALVATVFWYFVNPDNMWQVATAILIVACPCALALSAPFTNGNTIRVFGRNRFYLKSAPTAEKLNAIDTIVFDKTGTLTESGEGKVKFFGKTLTEEEGGMVRKLVENSIHPVSQKIKKSLKDTGFTISDFKEIPGNGLQGTVNGHLLRLGKPSYIGMDDVKDEPGRVYLAIDGISRGYFEVRNQYREGLSTLVGRLQGYKLAILSGDNDHERSQLEEVFTGKTEMRFRQQPQDKLDYIKQLQEKGHKVMMLGDGLNDAGALKQSDVGIAVTEDVSSFSPACDGILEGGHLKHLATYLDYAKYGKNIIIASFVISFLYNVVGLTFAITGVLTPIFAAILMPLSSISVVAFATFTGNYFAHKKHLF
ncbi:heavy metal translocating P-type ATPase metal-binding domain-containing protein [Fulvivirga sp. 29W222]|uniref:Heavy metal translocating P-type ATPase metal-binding domain-containing protein n=1 Tax=Fulvivirga marina TaxID=2494733 RepID=A0A937KDR0_9BACT|nr:heavy metal translocating P-type ATPase metal-binding domain-containing protein [Fulvivirga marina]MBL6449386.1 heavy metal translocating P-type ATPase metal-binding domain-containing protein [Fulvivirga marina]